MMTNDKLWIRETNDASAMSIGCCKKRKKQLPKKLP